MTTKSVINSEITYMSVGMILSMVQINFNCLIGPTMKNVLMKSDKLPKVNSKAKKRPTKGNKMYGNKKREKPMLKRPTTRQIMKPYMR